MALGFIGPARRSSISVGATSRCRTDGLAGPSSRGRLPLSVATASSSRSTVRGISAPVIRLSVRKPDIEKEVAADRPSVLPREHCWMVGRRRFRGTRTGKSADVIDDAMAIGLMLDDRALLSFPTGIPRLTSPAGLFCTTTQAGRCRSGPWARRSRPGGLF